MAGVISGKHVGEGTTIVTAACDRVSIENPLREICDLEYSGSVTYASGKLVISCCIVIQALMFDTGRSSLEVTCKVAKFPMDGQPTKPEDILFTCMFTMVALDPETKKYVLSQAINASSH